MNPTKSYRNDFEAELVVNYVKRILEETDAREETVGVITPYKCQVSSSTSVQNQYFYAYLIPIVLDFLHYKVGSRNENRMGQWGQLFGEKWSRSNQWLR